jgi:hypothetical protein
LESTSVTKAKIACALAACHECKDYYLLTLPSDGFMPALTCTKTGNMPQIWVIIISQLIRRRLASERYF